jgi:hypothetical protein
MEEMEQAGGGMGTIRAVRRESEKLDAKHSKKLKEIITPAAQK